MLIDLQKHGVLLEKSHFLQYLKLGVRAQQDVRRQVYFVIKCFMFFRKASPAQRELYCHYQSLMPDMRWLRYASDGNCMQMYDPVNLLVGKLPALANKRKLMAEVEARERAGDLSPMLYQTNIETGWIVEQWIHAPVFRKPTPGEITGLLKELSQRLGPAVSYSTVDYLEELVNGALPSSMFYRLPLAEVPTVEVAMCHGDFWSGNILRNESGELRLIDWEYCGRRIVSFDLWFFTYNECKPDFGLDFFTRFGAFYKKVLDQDLDIEVLKCLHLIHLYERVSNQLDLGKPHNSEEILMLQSDINRAQEILKYDAVNR